jgi:hypothetical protein
MQWLAAASEEAEGSLDGACLGTTVEPPVPPLLFELHVPDVSALHGLVADIWNR